MGYWGVKSYENDLAHDALDAGFEAAHGAVYDDLMDDANPITFEQVQRRLANQDTLRAALESLESEAGCDETAWDAEARLAFAGIVVRHVELKVSAHEDAIRRAIGYLESEQLEWDELTQRNLRRDKEIALLKNCASTL